MSPDNGDQNTRLTEVELAALGYATAEDAHGGSDRGDANAAIAARIERERVERRGPGTGETQPEPGMEQVDMAQPKDQAQNGGAQADTQPRLDEVAAKLAEQEAALPPGCKLHGRVEWPVAAAAEFAIVGDGKLEFRHARIHTADGQNLVVGIPNMEICSGLAQLLNWMHGEMEQLRGVRNMLATRIGEMVETQEFYERRIRTKNELIDKLQSRLQEFEPLAVENVKHGNHKVPDTGAIVEGSGIVDAAEARWLESNKVSADEVIEAGKARGEGSFRGPEPDRTDVNGPTDAALLCRHTWYSFTRGEIIGCEFREHHDGPHRNGDTFAQNATDPDVRSATDCNAHIENDNGTHTYCVLDKHHDGPHQRLR